MPIPLPNLDDRSYADLVEEALARIPAITPDWTDFNPSDPGIVLVELLAFLTDMLIYRIDDLPPASTRAFVELLGGPADATDLTLAVHQTVQSLRERFRAVSAEDYERLALDDWNAAAASRQLGDAGRVRRAICLPGHWLAEAERPRPLVPTPGPVTLVVVPDGAGATPAPSSDLLGALAIFLEERRLLGTRHHIVGPEYVPVRVQASLYLLPDVEPAAGIVQAQAALAAFFHPLRGGGGDGWPFGRTVYPSEIYALLDRLPLVDHVRNVRLNGAEASVPLDADQLVAADVTGITAVDAYRYEYRLVNGRAVLQPGRAADA